MENNHDSIAADVVMTEENTQEEPIFTPQGEIINGEEYAKNMTDSSAKAIIKYLSSILKQYHLSQRPLDQLSDPYEVLMVGQMHHTQLRPSLTVTVNGSSFPDWVIEVVTPEEEEMIYLMKTGIYTEAGVKEYWIIDPQKQVIMEYNFKKNAFIPKIYNSPQRIKVSIYRDLFISFSSIFKAQ